MCTNQREIINKYTGHKLFVNCGKCPACLQEKAAHRVSRIKSNLKNGYVTLLVSLTYNRFSCPYVDLKEAFEFSQGKRMWLNVYRDCKKRKVRTVKDGDQYAIRYKTIYKRHVLQVVDYLKDVSFKGMKCVKHSNTKVGVPFYPDYQHFLSRLRINLKRKYGYEKYISVYACSEYGEESLRPHFHLLLFVPVNDAEIVRDAVFESWPFSDMRRFFKYVNGEKVYQACQIAYSASSYVASYVNGGNCLSDFCRLYFKPKHSYSKGFGLARSSFSLDYLLSSLDKGEMSYRRKINKSGIQKEIDVLVPAYVINRFFPRFKGFNRFSPESLCDIMRRLYDGFNPYVSTIEVSDPLYELYGVGVCHYSRNYPVDNLIYLSDDDVYKISVSLHTGYDRFCRSYQFVPLDEYFRLHRSVWNCYSATALKLWLLNDDIPMVEKYDNLDSVFLESIPTDLDLSEVKETDINLFYSVITRTRKFRDDFFRSKHDRRVRNSVYISNDRHCEL